MGKIKDRWESQPLVMLALPYPDHCVYNVRPESKEGPERILHLHSLRPCHPCQLPHAAENTEPQASETNQALLWEFCPPLQSRESC